MRTPQRPSLSFVLLVSLCAMPPVFQANAAQETATRAKADTSDQDRRREAVALFSQGKRLEALPLLEEQVQKNPHDAELLVDLGATLIDHAATLSDQEAAAKEPLSREGSGAESLGVGECQSSGGEPAAAIAKPARERRDQVL
jgi:hypothetical protein